MYGKTIQMETSLFQFLFSSFRLCSFFFLLIFFLLLLSLLFLLSLLLLSLLCSLFLLFPPLFFFASFSSLFSSSSFRRKWRTLHGSMTAPTWPISSSETLQSMLISSSLKVEVLLPSPSLRVTFEERDRAIDGVESRRRQPQADGVWDGKTIEKRLVLEIVQGFFIKSRQEAQAAPLLSGRKGGSSLNTIVGSISCDRISLAADFVQ